MEGTIIKYRFSGNVIVPFYSEKDAENALN